MNERVLAKNQTSATPSQAIQASSPPLHQSPSTSGLSEFFGSNSNISKGLGGIQPKTIRRSLNWQNISVEAPSRSDGRSSPGGIQRRQEEAGAVMGDRLSGDSVQKSALESSNSTISTEKPAQKPLIARAPLNGRNIPVEAPPRSAVSSTSPGGIQRLETSDVKEQQVSTESLQRGPEGAIQAKSSEGEPQEKEEQNKESVQTKLTVGAPGDKYEQEADSMAAKVMRMPDPSIQQPIQSQTGEGTKAVQMQPLVNSITPLLQRSSGKEEEVQMKPGARRASDGTSQASANVEKRLAGSKGGGSPLPKHVRSFMEPRFGADLSSVRAHTDSNAVQMNKELGAQAFAHGSDIYYGTGKSPGIDELTGHEVAHVIQQEKKENKLQAKPDATNLTSTEPPTASPDAMEWTPTEQPPEAWSKKKRKNLRDPSPTSSKQQKVNSETEEATGEPSSSSTNNAGEPSNKKRKGQSKENSPSPRPPKKEKTKTPTEQAMIKMGYELKEGQKGKVAHPIIKASSNNVQAKPNAKEICYVASVPTRIKDKAPRDIAKQYVEEGFKNSEDAERRFGLVVGVNEYESITDINASIKGLIKNKVDTAPGWKGCRLGVLGFTWQAQWEKSKDNKDPSLPKKPSQSVVTEAYKRLDPPEKKLIDNFEKSNKAIPIPYDGIREEIKKHSFTKGFQNDLTNDNTVYLVTGDSDAVSLKAAPPSVEEVTQGLEALNVGTQSSKNGKEKETEVPVQQMAKTLFERYDQIIRNYIAANNGETPAIVSGGYEFRMKGLGGQTGDALRGAANKLDMAVRQAMAKINPNTVYFPEPNTIFKMKAGKKVLDVTFSSGSNGKSEGQSLVAKMRKQKQLENKQMIFNLEAAIETNSDRFNTIIDGKEVNLIINWTGGEIPELKEEHIKALFESSQTHVSKLYWMRRVMPQYPGGKAYEDPKKLKQVFTGRGKAIGDVYNHYFPHEVIGGFKPELLKQKLNTYTNEATYGKVSKETKDNLNLTGDYESVISLAKESGKAVEIFLKEVLGI